MSPIVLALGMGTVALVVFMVAATAVTVRADARRNSVVAARWRRRLVAELHREALRGQRHPRPTRPHQVRRGAA